MAFCIKCTSVLDENEQNYAVSDMGPEIVSVIEQHLGYQTEENGVMCSQCFRIVMQEMHSDSVLAHEDYELQQRHDSNVCVLCRTSLFRRRVHSIPEGAERHYIAETIAPREIPEAGLVCYACWVHIQRTLQQNIQRTLQPRTSTSPAVDLNACVWCRRSLAQTRRHTIPEGPERNVIAARICPREIPPGGLVCYACWVAARRNVERASNIDTRRQTPGPSNLHQDSVCAWCRISLHRRSTHIAIGPVRDEVAARIYPNELSEHALLCTNCWVRAQDSMQIPQDILHVQELDIQTTSSLITLDGFTHTTQTSAHCFVPECNNIERNRVPSYLRKIILKTEKIFVTDNARVCNEHISVYNWEFLDQNNFTSTFSKIELESMLRLSLQDDEIKHLDFDHINNIDEELFRFWTGITKDNFMYMLNVVSPALACKSPKTALGMYLVKARTGDSHERIASLFHMGKASVTRLLLAAREALLSLFVPLHLGINQTRDNLINRNLLIPEGLFGNREARVPIAICDGTYIYLQKSSNYLL